MGKCQKIFGPLDGGDIWNLDVAGLRRETFGWDSALPSKPFPAVTINAFFKLLSFGCGIFTANLLQMNVSEGLCYCFFFFMNVCSFNSSTCNVNAVFGLHDPLSEKCHSCHLGRFQSLVVNMLKCHS